ncbi:MAG: YegP family protein [Deltaproteobacteria bacterium]|nr:YegP family protein [Deltaproteobacteria bacterium]
MPAKFEIMKRRAGQYTYNLLASNGIIILNSGFFTSKSDVISNIEAVKRYASSNESYQRSSTDGDGAYFVLKGPDGNILGRSKHYLSIAGLEKGIASVMRNAPRAVVKDWTL